MITKFFATEADLLQFAATFANIVATKFTQKNGVLIFLYGPLGAGKTTLARGFLHGLGYQKKVKSPTYTLVESYDIKRFKVFHFDFYRLHNAKELDHIGLQDYFSIASICLIEWPEKGGSLLPKSDLSCYIAFKDQGRELHLEAHSELGKKILKLL